MFIDSDRYGESGIETMFFPGGEPHVKLPLINEPVLLYLKLRTWNDVGFAALVLDAITRQKAPTTVFIPYFPAARQDRADGLAPLTLDIIYKMLCVTPQTHVFDGHSYRLFTKVGVSNIMPSDLDLDMRDDIVGVIAPDAGAESRARLFRNRFCPQADILQCSKKRDQQTGRLSGYHMPSLMKRGSYIIVDDICDGGGTFNLLADAFKADPLAKVSSLELFVSHGIFSRGLENIDPVITKITTTNSWCQLQSNDRLTVINLLPKILPLILKD